MRRRALLGVGLGALLAAVIGVVLVTTGHEAETPIQISRADVVKVRFEPRPEGTPPPPFARVPTTFPFYSLDLVEEFIPTPLPAQPGQGGCAGGDVLIIELADGRAFTYGPCQFPPSIETLRARMRDVISGRAELLDIRLEDIERIRLHPVPEGPAAPPFESTVTDSDALSIDLIVEAIPIPLPVPLDQGDCSIGYNLRGDLIGGNLIIEVTDGRVITYGPCRRPPEIDLLWARMVEVITGGTCLPAACALPPPRSVAPSSS